MIDIQSDEPWPIPDGWQWKKMGDISTVIGGGTPKTSVVENWKGGSIPWITPADLSNYAEIWIEGGRRFITEKGLANSSAKLMPKGTVLMSSRAPIGHLAIASNRICTNQGFKSFVLEDGVDSEYVYFYLSSIKHLIQTLGTGTTFREISGKVCKTISIPIPPIEEQLRIKERLLQNMQNLSSLSDSIALIEQRCALFQSSLLKAACEGELVPTEAEIARQEGRDYEPADQLLERILRDRRARFEAENPGKKYKEPIKPDTTKLPKLPKGWVYASIDQLVEGGAPVCYGILQPGPVQKVGIPYVRPTEIVDGHIDLDNVRLTTPEIAAKFPRSVLKQGDVLLSIVGTIGKVAVVPPELEGGNITQSSARIRVNPSLSSSRFVRLLLESPVATKRYDAARLGTAVPRLNIHHVRELILPLPPLAEQERISSRADVLLSSINSVQRRLMDSSNSGRHLINALFSHAFSGVD